MITGEKTTVIYDACLLYPAPLRSFLMYLALTDLFRARWTEDIHKEWMRSVLSDYPDIDHSQVERIRRLMDINVRDCLVTGYRPLIASLTLPDPDDRHVLAAAIRCGASLIVTRNLADFPSRMTRQHGVVARYPDRFVLGLLKKHPQIVCEAARLQRASLKNPPLETDTFLDLLKRQDMPQTVRALRRFADRL